MSIIYYYYNKQGWNLRRRIYIALGNVDLTKKFQPFAETKNRSSHEMVQAVYLHPASQKVYSAEYGQTGTPRMLWREVNIGSFSTFSSPWGVNCFMQWRRFRAFVFQIKFYIPAWVFSLNQITFKTLSLSTILNFHENFKLHRQC